MVEQSPHEREAAERIVAGFHPSHRNAEGHHVAWGYVCWPCWQANGSVQELLPVYANEIASRALYDRPICLDCGTTIHP